MPPNNDSLTPTQDNFKRYYTEKIWEWIPPIYRDEDGLAADPDVLRSIVEILAEQAAIARRSIDRLWEDQFIEFCDDWAIPYIGDLVGTRLVHELNRRGRRVDVFRTIFYRRRKGTPLVLERLTQDITGWEGTVVESFRRLGRTRHGFDPELAEILPEEPITPPGGWANLKSTRHTEQLDSPFDGLAHTPDFRQLRGHLGRYNIPKLNIHLYRLLPFRVELATAVNLGDGRFTFDPSGRDIPLFRPDQRPSAENWRPPQEWELPAPIPCRLLGDADYSISTELLDELTIPANSPISLEDLSRFVGIPFRHEARLRQTLKSLIVDYDSLTPPEMAAFETLLDQLLAGAITANSAKAYLVPSPIQPDLFSTAVAIATGSDSDPATPEPDLIPIDHQKIVSANLADWGTSLGTLSPEKTVAIDPERGRFWFPSPPNAEVPIWVPIYHYGFSGNIGAGSYDRQETLCPPTLPIALDGDIQSPDPLTWLVPDDAPLVGVLQFEDSKTYQPDANISRVEQLTLQAANSQRPYLNRVVLGNAQWIIQAEPKPADPDPETDLRTLVLDGLWIGITSAETAPTPAPCPAVPAVLVLAGTFDRVVIRYCTLDPGGERARVDPNECQAIPSVQLVIQGGTIEELIIESSIVGPILEDDTSDPPGRIQRLTIRDSIVHSIAPNQSPAIQTALGVVDLARVTIFGDVIVKELFASESLIQGIVRVADNQHGCFRFSATNDDPQTRLPSSFESHLFAPAIPNFVFVSRRFGDPGYAQLSDRTPSSIRRGAENCSEIGAFSHLFNPIKGEDLAAKVNEFMPFGLIAQFIHET